MFVGMKTQFPPGINKVSLIRKNLGEMFQKKINILKVIIYKLPRAVCFSCFTTILRLFENIN